MSTGEPSKLIWRAVNGCDRNDNPIPCWDALDGLVELDYQRGGYWCSILYKLSVRMQVPAGTLKLAQDHIEYVCREHGIIK